VFFHIQIRPLEAISRPIAYGSVIRRILLGLGMCGFLVAGALSGLAAERPGRSTNGGRIRLEFQVLPAPREVDLTRLDLLLSQLALQKADGTWLESKDWFAFLSKHQNRLQAEADGIPEDEYQAIRFQVGLPDAIDRGNPTVWPVDHALHPEKNGMHWGWQGGYVFVAVEGKVGQEGFSYHLAGEEARRMVELPMRFTGGGPLTISLTLDPKAWLSDLDLSQQANSTHSRPGDELATRLADRAASAFRVKDVAYDWFQPTSQPKAVDSLPPGTHTYELKITERFPAAPLPQDNPLTHEGVELGRRLFNENRLSRLNTQSCASCHKQELAFSDDKDVSLGGEGQVGSRNAMPLFNLAWHKAYFWDGRAKTLREQVLMPIQDRHEMNAPLELVVERLSADDLYPTHFTEAFGSAGITPERIAKALEQYLLTLISQDSRFDQAVRKKTTLSAEEKRGLQLFLTEYDPQRGLYGADCFHCHGGTQFTNHSFTNNGLPTRTPADKGKFKAPSLRNIALTAPYMHDGRFNTLEEVVQHYSSGVQRTADLDPNLAKHPAAGINLSADDQRALVAFLKTLTDETFTRPDKPSLLTHR
jgi:cytochrome c peroxidase